MIRAALAAACALALLSPRPLAISQFESHARVLFPGSRFALRFADGNRATYAVVAGPGVVEHDVYLVPSYASVSRATVVATSGGALAVRALRIAAPPRGPVIAVATYDDGITFHDPRSFSLLGTLATEGAPSDVASLRARIATTDTDGTSLTSVALGSWRVTATPGVPLGDEIATDAPLGAFFVTERELNGKGGVVRVTSHGRVSVVTGTTAEGIAVDETRQRVYVADVNDDAVSAVDARAMRVLYRIGGLPRAFSLALSTDGRRLFVVSNQGVRTPFGAPGSVIELALYPRPRVVAKSAALSFPIGIALDSARGTIFVTDEEADIVDVLDEHTLRPRHAPLSTCSTPWKPAIDARSGRLFVPCAGSDEVDAFDARTLARVRGAPFPTGGYPLAVTVVRP